MSIKYYIMSSDSDLINLMKKYRIPLNEIVMKDEFIVKKGNHIINMADSSDQGNGTHWVALIVIKPNCIYFDSFGCSMPETIKSKLKKAGYYGFLFNNWIIQDLKSVACGYYCCSFLIYMNNVGIFNPNTYNKFINYFEDDTKVNEKILNFMLPYK